MSKKEKIKYPNEHDKEKDNIFELHEPFKLEPPNISINRTSFGVCYD